MRTIASSSAGNCYGWDGLLIEAGIKLKDIMKGLDYKAPKAVLITHEHGDHAKAAKELHALGVDIYASRGTLDAINVNGIALTPMMPFQILDFQVLPLPAVHDAAEPLMFVIGKENKRVLFATDTADIPYNISGLTEIMIECNFSERLLMESSLDISARRRIWRNHLSLEKCIAFLESTDLSKVRKITLLHLSGGHSDEAEFIKTIIALTGKPVEAAKKG